MLRYYAVFNAVISYVIEMQRPLPPVVKISSAKCVCNTKAAGLVQLYDIHVCKCLERTVTAQFCACD